MSRLYEALNQPEPPEGFTWVIRDGDNHAVIRPADDNYDHAATVLASESTTIQHLELLAEHGDDWTAITATAELAVRLVQEGNPDA
jgi:hypothetical protein